MPFSTSSHSFIFIGDTHVGNNFGVCTPDPELPDGQGYYHANELQQKLYEGYQTCINNIKQPNKIQSLFLAGDLCDGMNPKKPGVDLWTVDPIVAAYDFNKLIWPVASKAPKVFGIRGSDYHVSPDRTTINYDELACQLVGTNQYKTTLHHHNNNVDRKALSDKVKTLRAKGKKSRDIDLNQLIKDLQYQQQQEVKVDGTKLAKKLGQGSNVFKKELDSTTTGLSMPYPLTNVRFKGMFGTVAIVLKHFVSFSPNYMYRGTGLIRNDMIQTAQKEKHFPDGYSKIIYAYGHAHYLHWSGNATHYNFVIPCFKANDNYLKANGVTEPDYGIIEVIIEPNEEILLYSYTLQGDAYPVEEPVKI